MQINFGSRSVSCKIVYYGPGLSGKTTNIQKVHDLMPGDRKGDLTSIKTEGDRTLFFDFMSLDLGKVGGMDTRFQIYTVPGQVYYDATRKLVLQGADGIVFVADSSPDRMEANLESWQNLKDNLAERKLSVTELPTVLQWNKRDVPGAVATEELNARLNDINAPTFDAVATEGTGVLDTLKAVCAMVCKQLNTRARTASASMTVKPAVVAAAPEPEPVRAATVETMQFVSRRRRAAATTMAEAVTATLVEPEAPEKRSPAPAAAAPTPPTPDVAPAPPKAPARRPAPPVFETKKSSSPAWVPVLTAAGILTAVAAVLYILFG